MTEKLSVHQAILAVKEGVGAVRKLDRNQQQGFSFRGIDAVVNALSPELIKAGLTIYPVVQSVNRNHAQTAAGKTMNVVDLIAGYVFTGPDGSTLTATVAAEAFDSGDKATAKAMSVAFRTVLLQTFALPTDEVDADEETHEASGVDPQEAARQHMVQTFNVNFAKAKGNRANLEAMQKWAAKNGFPKEAQEKITEALNELENTNE